MTGGLSSEQRLSSKKGRKMDNARSSRECSSIEDFTSTPDKAEAGEAGADYENVGVELVGHRCCTVR